MRIKTPEKKAVQRKQRAAAVIVLMEPSLIPGLAPTEPHRMEM